MTNSFSSRPSTIKERFLTLDAIRGFALLGIMFVNMTWFSGFAVLSSEETQALGTRRVDELVNWLIEVFVAGKFWTIFAFLFGVGVAIQFAKHQDDGRQLISHYVRRISILWLLGLAHGVLLWFGDIISLYAAAGFVLLLFISCSDKTKLIWGVGLLVLPVLQVAIWLIVFQQSGASGTNPGHGPGELLSVFGTGSYFDVLTANWEFLKERWLIAFYDGRFLKLAGLFLIGWWVGKQNILWKTDKHKKLLVGVVLVGLLVGLPVNLFVFSFFPHVALRPPSVDGLMVESLKAIGIPTLGLGYVAAMALGLSYWPNLRGAKMLAVVGRLSLTNYVMQSVIGVVVFYGYGFQQWGRFGVVWTLPLILALFGFQIVFSYLWLRFFMYGPLEWIWRCLTYGRMLPIRNHASV